MPELPEVETTRRGLAPHVVGRRVTQVVVREARLRWPVPLELPRRLRDQPVLELGRRAKYLLFRTPAGTLMVHLGMSGSLRILPAPAEPGRHDHIDLALEGDRWLRYTDPRRFGSFHWLEDAPERHPLLAHLGPEPLGPDFSGEYLFQRARGRRPAVKSFLMDSAVVVGVGNIYANEALYLAGIRPDRPAGDISLARYRKLAEAVRQVLTDAIAAGGTTLRDFVGGEGKPGYFAQQLRVYGRGGEACPGCGAALRMERLGQRATYYCGRCQR